MSRFAKKAIQKTLEIRRIKPVFKSFWLYKAVVSVIEV